uniref:Uncharacterized protein n=1 Tax=viral metagenome TaxID=1070528 RepID=A0A6C0LAP9_9ZZZZ
MSFVKIDKEIVIKLIMKILSLGLLILISNTESTRIVPRKLCKDCKYFIAHKKECALFGDTDLVNGKHDYNYAKNARNNENKCGEEAKFFEENNNKIMTVPYYFILNTVTYWPLTPVIALFFIYINALYKFTHPE